MRLLIDQGAIEEIGEAAAFYEDAQTGLGSIFFDVVNSGFKEIIRHPYLWRKIEGDVRRYLIHRFPYGLIYIVYEDVIYIAAVMHLKRKPGYWRRRVAKSKLKLILTKS